MSANSSIDFDSPRIKRYNRIRKIKDKVASVGIAFGGIGVIAAILLIFMYLLYEVVPMFRSADVTLEQHYSVEALLVGGSLSEDQKPLYLAVEEQNEVGLMVGEDGGLNFFNVSDGSLKTRIDLAVPNGLAITAFALNNDSSGVMAFGLEDGSVLIAKHRYKVSYPNDKRLITPVVEYPFGETPLALANSEVTRLVIRDEEESLVLIADTAQGLVGTEFVKEESFFSDDIELVPEALDLPNLNGNSDYLLVDISRTWLAAIKDKTLHIGYLKSGEHEQIELDQGVSDARFLLGGLSLLLAMDDGTVSQWFQVRDEDGIRIEKIRSFSSDEADKPLTLALEQRRKGFATVNESGYFELFHSTAARHVFGGQLFDKKPLSLAISPRANMALVLDDAAELHIVRIDNEHPETSFSALWQKVWYESYDEPNYTWQSSSSSNDFEPKLSLTPLAFGTLKAAFYAMLLGAPLAIFGAIYTAYFMTAGMRRKIKPLIELMEALPTVILGFLAGLWLAPFMEENLTGIFTLLMVLPVGIVLFAFGMSRLPMKVQNRIDEGWHSLILIPVIIVLSLSCFAISPYIELWLFGGDMRAWITTDLGISFDQRNALVVGVAMGFAVIPTIFSIAEDAIFSVPKHLSYGSLALGATPWQTLRGVIIPTASPGIFSALMIGLGRAVGETMIVLMATGNTPIMDANIFEGMRTLSANLAVEIPEAEVASTHYRVLFMAAFVLFLFTFVVNTAAEVVRQRLRNKYGSL